MVERKNILLAAFRNKAVIKMKVSSSLVQLGLLSFMTPILREIIDTISKLPAS